MEKLQKRKHIDMKHWCIDNFKQQISEHKSETKSLAP